MLQCSVVQQTNLFDSYMNIITCMFFMIDEESITNYKMTEMKIDIRQWFRLLASVIRQNPSILMEIPSSTYIVCRILTNTRMLVCLPGPSRKVITDNYNQDIYIETINKGSKRYQYFICDFKVDRNVMLIICNLDIDNVGGQHKQSYLQGHHSRDTNNNKHPQPKFASCYSNCFSTRNH